MNAPRKFAELTIPEKIVWIFQQKIRHGHREAIETALKLDPEQYTDAIRHARDLGLAGIDPKTGQPALDKRDKSGRTEIGPIYLTQVYERKGWWTCQPTDRIVAIAIEAGRRRNLSEAQREVRLYGAVFGVNIGYAARSGEAGQAVTGAIGLPLSRTIQRTSPLGHSVGGAFLLPAFSVVAD
jgi:hypothetical protein